MRYVALLRGINVGGKNLIAMPALKACLEEQGFENVRTYIQSGNVLFDVPKAARGVLTRTVERAIEETFSLPIAVVLRPRSEMVKVVAERPTGFGSRPDDYRYDVAYLKEPLTAGVALTHVPIREGVDQAWPGRGVLYYARLVSRLTQSKMSKVAATPIYKQMTIRNWNTTLKLVSLLEADP